MGIRKRKEGEEGLEGSLELLGQVLAGTHDGYWRIDAGGCLLDVNPAYCRMSGYTRDELVGRRIEDLNPFLARAELIRRMEQVTMKGSARFRSRHRAKDGRLFDVELYAIRISEGGHSIGFIQDITPLIQREERLRESEARMRELLDGAPLAVAMTRQGRFLYVNRHYAVLHDYPRSEDLVGTSILDRVHPDDQDQFADFPERLARGEEIGPTFEFRALRKDGTGFWVSASVRQLQLEDGPATIGFLQDITGRKRAEQDRERLILELREALDKVRTLHGLLPICSHCKKIRDDSGYWNQLESYFATHTEVSFTHGICPECAKIFYPEFHMKEGKPPR